MLKKKTGIVYHEDFLLHTNHYHPECKNRLEAIMDKLEKEDMLDKLELIVPETKASVKTIAMVHNERYIGEVEQSCLAGLDGLDMDTYLTAKTYEVARLAVQGGLEAVKNVMNGRLEKVFALLRPPGHHAEPDRGMGFCIFNNIAIASRFLQKEYGLQRIMIVDWDVHHGNGTQRVFEDDPGVLYFSVHQSPAFPGTGSLKEVGKGAGKGYTINVPLRPGCGDSEYMALFQEIVLPVMSSYRPEILLISAGQDAYTGDPLASMKLSLQGYTRMTELLLQGAERHTGGKMVFFLEGGYNSKGLASIVYNVLNVLAGLNLPFEEENPLGRGGYGADIVRNVRNIHKEFWPALK